MIIDCNHGGAEEQEAYKLEFDHDAGMFAATGSDLILVCDKCDKQYEEESGEWYE